MLELPTVAVFAVAILFVSVFLFKRWFKIPLIPGPELGEYFRGGDTHPIYENSDCTNRTLLRLSEKYGDVFQLRIGPLLAVVTCVPQDIVHIVSATESLQRPPNVLAVFNTMAPGGIFTMEKERHGATKRVLRENFNYSMLQGFHAHMAEIAKELCHTLAEIAREAPDGEYSRPVDIAQHMAVTTLGIILKVGFGFAMSREESMEVVGLFDVAIDEMSKDSLQYPIRQMLTPFGVRNRLFETRDKIVAFCRKCIEKRLAETEAERQSRHRDILDTILKEYGSDIRLATSVAMEFTIAGYHTTNQTITWSLYATCTHPHVMDKLGKEIMERFSGRAAEDPVTTDDLRNLPYLHKVWKETQRLHTIAGGVTRVVHEDMTLKGSGTFVPKGTRVLAHIMRAQRHPAIWRDAETFRPERWGTPLEPGEGDRVPSGAFLPYSAGPRSCPGKFLAEREGLLVLAELHRRFAFQLGCKTEDIVSCTRFVEMVRAASVPGGPPDMGLPLRVRLRSEM